MVEGEGNGRVCDTPRLVEWWRGRVMAGYVILQGWLNG